MNLTVFINKPLLKRKLATAVLITASLAAFATLGDGGRKNGKKSLLCNRSYTDSYNDFSLKSGFNFRGNNPLSLPRKPEGQYIILNTQVTYQKGNVTYVLPLKKKVLLDKVNFRSTAYSRY